MVVNHAGKKRIYLDPIHGPIQLFPSDPLDNLLIKIIDTREFQRLRRIKQMGLGWFTFHGAEHTRFGHSIGALEMARKILEHLSRTFKEINNFKNPLLICALLHDVGHGPFSHTSEKLNNFKHEDWTRRIIEDDSEINKLISNLDKNLISDIIKIFEYKSKFVCLSQIISSYIDCDRLDYLHRDSYYVGVPYGLTGSERIIVSFEINETRLVVNEKIGLDAVIHYLQARMSMYQQIYQHKKNLACDFLLRRIMERIEEVKPKNVPSVIYDWLNIENKSINEASLESFLRVDDHILLSKINELAYDSSGDKLLRDLASRFINRRLFKSLEFRIGIDQETISSVFHKIKEIAKQKGFNENYYVGIEQSATKPYEPYITSGQNMDKAIFIKQSNGVVKELSEVSGLVKALSKENIVKTCLVFTPELENGVTDIKGFQELFK